MGLQIRLCFFSGTGNTAWVVRRPAERLKSLGAVHFFFAVPIRGSLAFLMTVVLGYLPVELSKGPVISVVSHSQHQAFLPVMMVGMTDSMFTGYAAPVESMPKVMHLLAWFVPTYHRLTILRGILLKGAGVAVLWQHLLALAGLGVTIGALSLRYVRQASD